MPRQVRFDCPHCKASFNLPVASERFACPDCGERYLSVDLDGWRRGWVYDQGSGWAAAVSQQIHPFSSAPRKMPSVSQEPGVQALPMGAARLRREKRLSRRIHPAAPLLILALLLAGFALVSPIVAQGRSSEAGQPPDQETQAWQSPIVSESHVVEASAAATRSPVTPPTRTPTPTRAPTQTPLPPHLAAATAWQVTLEQASYYSLATQTQAAGKYAATQTALPPILTAKAEDRQATAASRTQTATAKARH